MIGGVIGGFNEKRDGKLFAGGLIDAGENVVRAHKRGELFPSRTLSVRAATVLVPQNSGSWYATKCSVSGPVSAVHLDERGRATTRVPSSFRRNYLARATTHTHTTEIRSRYTSVVQHTELPHTRAPLARSRYA